MIKRILLLISLLLSTICFGQDPNPELFSAWYITEFIEQGVSYPAPDGYPIEIFDEGTPDCPTRFSFPNPYAGGEDCLSNVTSTQFNVHWLGVLAEGTICLDGPDECLIFFANYDDFFQNALMTGNPISYEITENPDNTRTLTLTNLAGDQAIYSNQYLATQDIIANKVVVFPNPVEDTLYINAPFGIDKILVYSLQGELILETSSKEIDFSFIQRGLYFVKILNNNRVDIHKILKK